MEFNLPLVYMRRDGVRGAPAQELADALDSRTPPGAENAVGRLPDANAARFGVPGAIGRTGHDVHVDTSKRKFILGGFPRRSNYILYLSISVVF